MEGGGKWEDYKIGELFDKLDLRFKKGKFDKDNDVSKIRNDEFNLPLVNAKNGDNGIMYYGRASDFDSAEMTIDIVNDGAVSTGNVYPQPQKTGVLYNAYLIQCKYPVTKNLLCFLSSCIQKSIKLKFGYENKAGWEKVKKEEIQLPTRNGKIDFAFMENFIAELKTLRIAKLHAYLQVTGLSNYTLTEAEQNALNTVDAFSEQEFFISDIFSIQSPKKKFNAKDLKFEGLYPYVARGEKDNGIRGYITEDTKYLNAGNTISFGQDTATIYYQKEDYFTGDKIKIFSLKGYMLNRYIANYLISQMSKAFSNFSWGNMFNEKVINSTKINLPIKDDSIDYAYMENLMKAIEKLVIKDVVDWADKQIEAIRQVIEE